MNINTNYSGYNIYPGITKQTYIDKFDKSVKIPFLKVLNSNILNTVATKEEDEKIDTSELAVSDNVELSSAVAGASQVSGDN